MFYNTQSIILPSQTNLIPVTVDTELKMYIALIWTSNADKNVQYNAVIFDENFESY